MQVAGIKVGLSNDMKLSWDLMEVWIPSCLKYTKSPAKEWRVLLFIH